MVATLWIFFAAVIYLLGVVFAIEAIMKARTPTGAIAWSLALASFPFLSVPLYLVLGRNRFQGMVEAYQENAEDIDRLYAEVTEALDAQRAPPSGLGDARRAIGALSGLDVVAGNFAELLINGEATFESILAGIGEARDYVLVQFYTIRDDKLGRRLQEALLERARAGVDVRVLYDDIGSLGLPRRYCSELESAGAKARSFKPDQGRRNRFQQNFRNHRKIVVVDGRVGWVGGHNVGDEYLGHNPKLTPWRDTHVRLEGPMVTQLQLVFFSDWYWAARELPTLNWTPRAASNGGIPGMVVPFAPTHVHETASLFFVAALNLARKRAWISAPYFVPDEAVMKALKLAALRGVDVRIVTTGTNDSLLVYFAAYHYIMALSGLGIRFYAYSPGFLHEKTLLVDDHVSSIGTANFDNRSFRLNFELTAVLLDEAFAEKMETMFENTIDHCKVLDPEALKSKGLGWQLAVNFCRLLSPIL